MGAVNVTSAAQTIDEQVRAHFQAAQQARARKDYANAEREYAAAIKIAPGFAESYLNLGLLYQLQERIPEAMEKFKEALARNPALGSANFLLGMDFCQRGEAARALPYLKAAARQLPSNAAVWAWLGTANGMLGSTKAEVQSLQVGLHLKPRDPDLLYLLGRGYEQLGHETMVRLEHRSPGSPYLDLLVAEGYLTSGYFSEALVRLRKVESAWPQSALVRTEIAEIFLRVGRLDLARKQLEPVLKQGTSSLPAIVQEGEIRLLEGNVDGALDDWSQALSTDPYRTENILGLTRAAFQSAANGAPTSQRALQLLPRVESRTSAAASLARDFLLRFTGRSDAVEVRPLNRAPRRPGLCTSANVREWIRHDEMEFVAACSAKSSSTLAAFRVDFARALVEVGKPEEALRTLDQASANASDPPEVIYWRIRAYRSLALQTYTTLYEVHPGSYRVHELLGNIHEAKGEDTEAIKEYRLALLERPRLPNLHYQLGHLLWKGFKTQEAEAEFTAELKLNPRHSSALMNLGAIRLYQHQPGEAIEYLQRAEKLDPANADIHHFLGQSYLELGRKSEALKELKLAAVSDHTAAIHFLLGKVYQAMGQRPEAVREFAISSALNQRAHQQTDERAQQLAQAELLLKQP